MSLLKLLDGKQVQVGVIDVASDEVETPEQVAAVIAEAMKYVAEGEASCRAPTAAWRRCGARSRVAKLVALAKGAELARKKFG